MKNNNNNIRATGDRDRTDAYNLDNELASIWGRVLPNNGDIGRNFVDDWNGITNNQQRDDHNVEDLGETLASTSLGGAAAAAFRNNPTRLNATTSQVLSDIGCRRETLRQVATDFDAAAAAFRNNPTRLNATTSQVLSDIGCRRETLRQVATDFDAAAAAFRNNPTRLNATTSQVLSDIGWRDTLRQVATDFDAAAAAFRNNPTRLNGATSQVVSNIGWRKTLRQVATDFDAAAAATRNTFARLNAGIRGLQIRGRGERVHGEGMIFQLMGDVDKFPVFNKLIDSADVSELRRIVAEIVSQPESLIEASLNQQGSKSVRKLISVLGKTGLVSDMNTALCTGNGFYRLMTDSTGSLTIFRCLDVASSEHNKLLYEAAIRYCLELAKHERGCLSLKKFITSCRGQGRQQLLDFIAEHSVYLSQDPTGNYVLQHVIAFDDPALTDKICSVLSGHYIQISLQKCGSHVVEKCLQSPGMEHVLEEFLRTENIHKLLQLARDRYGNYVVQTALAVTKGTDGPSHGSLVCLLKQHSKSLQSGYGSNVLKLILLNDKKHKNPDLIAENKDTNFDGEIK